MAYIAPNSVIKILRNVRLEPDYVNTIYFPSASSQANFFSGKTKYNLTAQSYQRANKGVCRVNYKVEDLYDCNYMMFQNTTFGNKWFYAFITGVDYINNVTSDIHYEIDVMQTWLKDMTFSLCFVEREHSATDAIGDNIVQETIDTGELVYNKYVPSGLTTERLATELDTYVIVVATLGDDPTSTTGQTVGNVYDGIYSGLHYRAFSLEFGGSNNPITEINNYVNEWIQHPDDVVAMFLTTMASFPDEVGERPTPSGIDVHWQNSAHILLKTWHQLHDTDTLDGHQVRNKKLFTYPFNYVHIDNANGKEMNLRYEFFKDSNGNLDYIPKFSICQNLSMPITAVLRPRYYKNCLSDAPSSSSTSMTSESLDLTNYPICSWTVDTWKAWVAQNSVPEAISAISGAIKFGISAGALTSGVGGAKSAGALMASSSYSGVSEASNVVSRIYKASIQSDICKGSFNNGNVNVASHMHNFFISRISVNRQMAEIIDDFFDKYGYATNRVKVPNVHTRPAWNYVKTIGSNVDGNIPGDDKRIIDANFDRGITFWMDGDRVDDYSQNNAPVSP